MNSSNIFPYTLIVFGICFAGLAIYTFLNMNKENISKNEKIPRNYIFGIVLAIIDIMWCIPQALAIFSPGSSTWIFPLAIICLVVGCLFLDFLFARAFAGFIILLSHYFLFESFAADISYLWLFSIACYVMGTFGIVIGGIPHLLRDFIRKISLNKALRNIISIVFVLYFCLGTITGIGLLIK